MGDVEEEENRKRVKEEGDDEVTTSPAKRSKTLSVSMENCDENQLLKIFPEELWTIMFEHVKDPTTLECCANASPYFYQILETRQVEYLFPKVLPLMVNSSEEIQKLNSIRLVCHSWCKSVEMFMVNHPFNFKIDQICKEQLEFQEGDYDSDSDDYDDEFSSQDKDTLKNHLEFFKPEDTDHVGEFMRMFENSPPNRNPLFHRKLVIQDRRLWNYREETQSFWESLTNFLRQFGMFIWFCDIRLQNSIMGFSYFFQCREWLELMPNLKVLHWRFPQRWADVQDSEGNEFGARIPIFLKCKLEDQVRKNPLPKLENLQVFKTDDLPYPMFRDFIKRNDQISKLQFHRKFPPPPQYQEFYEYDFANGLHNVTELSLVLWRREEIKELETSAASSTWPVLKKLNIYWGDYNNSDDGYNRSQGIFNLISKKCSKGALTNLQLRLPVATSSESKLVPQILNCTSVRVLKLFLQVETNNIDFLLPLKNTLEELTIKIENYSEKSDGDPDSSEMPQAIHYKGLQRRMYASNIWHLFPKLNKLVMKNVHDCGSNSLMVVDCYEYNRDDISNEILEGSN